jgi:lipopolysaccharide/colanic/teichoic acid biosynthesis glycosyltransferase
LFVLTLAAPLLLAICAAAWVGQSATPLHTEPRVGRGGRVFGMYRVRAGASPLGGGWVERLIQLIHVVRGEMSLIGPPPVPPTYVDLRNPLWRTVLTVRPGLWSYASLTSGLSVEQALTQADARTYTTRILPTLLALDAAYLNARSLRADARLIGRALLGRRLDVADRRQTARETSV